MLGTLGNVTEMIKSHRKPIFAFRMLVYNRKTGEKIRDRTFYGHTENELMSKFVAHITKEKLLRRYTPQKVKIRVKETSTHLIPMHFFARLEKETNGKVFLKDDESEQSISPIK